MKRKSPLKTLTQQIDELLETSQRKARVAEIRAQSLEVQERAHLILATAIFTLKAREGIAWRDMPKFLKVPFEFTTLYKLAERRIYVKLATYEILRDAVQRQLDISGVKLQLLRGW